MQSHLPNSNQKNLFLLEFNEANESLMALAAQRLSLLSLSRVLSMSGTVTYTDDTYESDFLEPWSQWVSVHTGVPASEHQIKHLGDVVNLNHEQIWETLSHHGIDSGIWGVMNGKIGSAQLCRFFLADPWTWDAPAYPSSLACLTNLACYIAKNYLSLSKLVMAKLGFSYGIGLLGNMSAPELLQASAILAEGLIRFGPGNLTRGAFFEYASACCFLNNYRKSRPQFGILFLNLIAHTQHHYWLEKDKLTPQLMFAFRVCDQILEKVMRQLAPSDVLLVANGFSQVNTADEPDWILYRAYDALLMLTSIGVEPLQIEPLMTNDIHLWFADKEQTSNAIRILESAHINGKQLFLVERDRFNPCKLFLRMQFTDPVVPGETFSVLDQSYEFARFFSTIVKRTAKHDPKGFVRQSRRLMPEKIANHEIHKYVSAYFSAQKLGRKSEREVVAQI